MKKFLFILCLAGLVFISCGSSLNGTYADESGIAFYTFKSNGVVTTSTMGIEVEQKYKVENGKVKIGTSDGSIDLTIVNATTIEGPMGVVLTKKK